jgi:hypothetical protein
MSKTPDEHTNNIKKTIVKVTKHYHSDKKGLLPDVFNEKDHYLRGIIIRMIT